MMRKIRKRELWRRTPLEVGSVRRVQVKKGDTREVHHFRVLEELKSV